MSRVKLSEFKAKQLLFELSNKKYLGVSVDLSKSIAPQIAKLSFDICVVKVDQAIKKRNKLGLVFVKRTKKQVIADLAILKEKGYEWALVEPFVAHEQGAERFIAMLRTADGIHLTYSHAGGVNIEENQGTLEECLLDHFDFIDTENKTSLPNIIIKKLYTLFQACHMTYLEINPALISGDELIPLDAAVEVDSAAKFFVKDTWGKEDIRDASKRSAAEKAIEDLDDKSPASFNLKVLHKDASVFLLLSGGGASIVVADEFATQGLHNQIANYGEYSGNPNEDETYLYTKELISLLLDSTATKKVLVIGGGTANFTDVAKTFKGVIRALDEVKEKLLQQGVSVFVRRGGPNHHIGLAAMKNFLEGASLKHIVCGPEVAIAAMVKQAVLELKSV